MEQAIYLKDSYLQEFDSKILEVNQEKFIILDKTAFYPNSGGQPFDTGKIICNNQEYNIVFVGKFEGKISHEVDKLGLKPGDSCHCIINWDRRYRFMRYHTAAHIISGLIHKESGALITGNQLGEDKSRIDFSLENFDREKLKEYIEKANIIIKENRNVKISFVSREEAEKQSKLALGDYTDITEFRLVEIEGLDIQPCGGTHIKNTSEIKGVELVDLENKGKGRKRLYFKLID